MKGMAKRLAQLAADMRRYGHDAYVEDAKLVGDAAIRMADLERALEDLQEQNRRCNEYAERQERYGIEAHDRAERLEALVRWHETNDAAFRLQQEQEAHEATLARAERLEAVLWDLVADYERLCGDGMTAETEPAVLRAARAALEGVED